MALTPRQRQIYDFICSFVDEKGYSPSLEEIGAEFGLSSVATVHKHVQHLVGKGYLRKSWNRSRSVEPVEQPSAASNAVTLPLLGTVAAGLPIEAIEEQETIEVPAQLVPRGGQSGDSAPEFSPPAECWAPLPRRRVASSPSRCSRSV